MSITAAQGFRAAGTHCGIKAEGVADLALVAADRPSAAAAVFTTSLTAAPVIELGRKHLADARLQAIVVVSGCANAGTGDAGLAAAQRVAETTAESLDCQVEDVLVATTGPIGPTLPDHLVRDTLPGLVTELGTTAGHASAAAEGIMTTDSVTKEAVSTADGWTIGGMAKGAGMVRPDMATMLAYLTTDARVEAHVLERALVDAVDATFNSLNIDGCQSTNDMVAVMASGASQVESAPDELTLRLIDVCKDLTVQMARDAEGATRMVRVIVAGTPDDSSARRLGKAVADSALVRSSFYGGDPNWGRVLGALGVAGVEIDQRQIAITYEGVEVAAAGVGVVHDETRLDHQLEDGDFTVGLSVGRGPGRAEIITTDLTPEYVRFNGERS